MMILNIKIKDILLLIGVIVIIFLLVFKSDVKKTLGSSLIDKIENKILESKTEIIKSDSVIYHTETIIVSETKLIKELNRKIDLLKIDLENVRIEKDTFMIIQLQDTIIEKLNIENKHLGTVINLKDSIIIEQRHIISYKDTIIDSKDEIVNFHYEESKKFKRQRNLSLVAGVVLIGILIFKK